MNTFENLFSRKSVRSYTGEAIAEDQLALVLKAAEAAPVGMGRYDAVHLSVITNPGLLEEIDEAGAEMTGRPGAKLLYGAPAFILVSAKISPAKENVAYSNAAIIVHNMALAAVEMGVGSCCIWGAVMAMNRKPALVKKLGLPEGFVPCSGIVLGVTEEKYAEREIDAARIAVNEIK